MIALISIYRAISRYIDYRDRPNDVYVCDTLQNGVILFSLHTKSILVALENYD